MKHNLAVVVFQFLLYFKTLKCLVSAFKIPFKVLRGEYRL